MAEVGRVGFADDDAAGGLNAARNSAVDFGDQVLLEDGTAGMAQSFAGFKILDGNGQAVERTEILPAHDCGFGGAGAVEGAVGVEVEKGVDGRVDGLDAGEDGFGQFDRRELFVPYGGGEFGGGCAEEFGRGHFRGSFRER